MSIPFIYDSAPQHKVLMCPKCGYVSEGFDTDTNIECGVCHASKLIITDYDYNVYQNVDSEFDIYVQHCKIRDQYLSKGLDPHHIALREEYETKYRRQYITEHRTMPEHPSQVVTHNAVRIK